MCSGLVSEKVTHIWKNVVKLNKNDYTRLRNAEYELEHVSVMGVGKQAGSGKSQ